MRTQLARNGSLAGQAAATAAVAAEAATAAATTAEEEAAAAKTSQKHLKQCFDKLKYKKYFHQQQQQPQRIIYS